MAWFRLRDVLVHENFGINDRPIYCPLELKLLLLLCSDIRLVQRLANNRWRVFLWDGRLKVGGFLLDYIALFSEWLIGLTVAGCAVLPLSLELQVGLWIVFDIFLYVIVDLIILLDVVHVILETLCFLQINNNWLLIDNRPFFDCLRLGSLILVYLNRIALWRCIDGRGINLGCNLLLLTQFKLGPYALICDFLRSFAWTYSFLVFLHHRIFDLLVRVIWITFSLDLRQQMFFIL